MERIKSTLLHLNHHTARGHLMSYSYNKFHVIYIRPNREGGSMLSMELGTESSAERTRLTIRAFLSLKCRKE